MNAFIESQFSHCPLVWMFCFSRRLNSRINHIHERALRIIYEDYVSSFKELLKRNDSVLIHHRNIQLVALEMFKVKNDLSPEIMKDIFQFNTNPRCKKTFVIPKVNTEYMGKLSLRYFGPVVWEIMLPDNYKAMTSIDTFKEAIKKWIPNCKCRLCKNYVPKLGFVWYHPNSISVRLTNFPGLATISFSSSHSQLLDVFCIVYCLGWVGEKWDIWRFYSTCLFIYKYI